MKQSRVFKTVASGLLIAVSILLTRLMAGNFLILGVPAARFSLGYLPILLAGALLGPGWGAGVGLIADVLGFFIFPNGAYFPPISLTSALAGLIPGLVFILLPRWRLWSKTLLSAAVVQVGCSLFLQTYWLSLLYGKGYLLLLGPRTAVALVLIPVYTLLLIALLKALQRAGYKYIGK